jgi:hypothetical protein
MWNSLIFNTLPFVLSTRPLGNGADFGVLQHADNMTDATPLRRLPLDEWSNEAKSAS